MLAPDPPNRIGSLSPIPVKEQSHCATKPSQVAGPLLASCRMVSAGPLEVNTSPLGRSPTVAPVNSANKGAFTEGPIIERQEIEIGLEGELIEQQRHRFRTSWCEGHPRTAHAWGIRCP